MRKLSLILIGLLVVSLVLVGCTTGKKALFGKAVAPGICQQAPEGMINYWSFEKSIRGKAFDSVGNNHGDVHNIQIVPGKVGNAFYFNGVNSWVNIPDLNLNDFTLEAWVKLDPGIGNQDAIVGQ